MAAPHPSSPLRVLAWAGFLASSWTWCIGMFLPVILARDFGLWSFLAFALPNVIGAAAFGAALAAPGASERFIAKHARMCRVFSLVTLAFQSFFLAWLLMGWGLGPTGLALVGAAFAGSVLAWGGSGPRGERAAWGGLGLVGASAALGVVFLSREGTTLPPAAGAFSRDLVWLAPVMVFGFAFCPYLDLTFHRARRALPGRAGTLAFVLGFGVLFLAMIVLTLLYATPLIDRAAARGVALGPQVLPAILGAHIALQLGYTAALHEQHVTPDDPAQPSPLPRGAGLGAFVVGVALALVGFAGVRLHAELSNAEWIYRGFMAFYGLVFPAYVWICVLPSWRRAGGPARREWAALGVACAIAGPMYHLGFIERQHWWLAPGLGVVLLTPLVIRVIPARRSHPAATGG